MASPLLLKTRAARCAPCFLTAHRPFGLGATVMTATRLAAAFRTPARLLGTPGSGRRGGSGSSGTATSCAAGAAAAAEAAEACLPESACSAHRDRVGSGELQAVASGRPASAGHATSSNRASTATTSTTNANSPNTAHRIRVSRSLSISSAWSARNHARSRCAVAFEAGGSPST